MADKNFRFVYLVISDYSDYDTFTSSSVIFVCSSFYDAKQFVLGMKFKNDHRYSFRVQKWKSGENDYTEEWDVIDHRIPGELRKKRHVVYEMGKDSNWYDRQVKQAEMQANRARLEVH